MFGRFKAILILLMFASSQALAQQAITIVENTPLSMGESLSQGSCDVSTKGFKTGFCQGFPGGNAGALTAYGQKKTQVSIATSIVDPGHPNMSWTIITNPAGSASFKGSGRMAIDVGASVSFSGVIAEGTYTMSYLIELTYL